MDHSSFLFLSSVSRITGRVSSTVMETQERSTPRVRLCDQLKYQVNVSIRPVEVFVPPFMLDRTPESIDQGYRSESRVWSLETVLFLYVWRWVKSLCVLHLDELGPSVRYRDESIFRGSSCRCTESLFVLPILTNWTLQFELSRFSGRISLLWDVPSRWNCPFVGS